jgi:hypothetical protein
MSLSHAEEDDTQGYQQEDQAVDKSGLIEVDLNPVDVAKLDEAYQKQLHAKRRDKQRLILLLKNKKRNDKAWCRCWCCCYDEK